MFHHLDDPQPPVPSKALAQTLKAEGARRRRRRASVVGGAALATALVVGLALRPWDGGGARVEVGPSDTSGTEPALTTTLPEVTTTTTADASDGSTFPSNTFAAVTKDGRVVLADLDTGTIMVELDQLDDTGGYFVARAPDGSAVYAGGFVQGLWRYAPGVPPARLATAAAVSVSPDGTRLAAVSADAEGQGTIRILDSRTGDVLEEVSVPVLTGDGDRYVSATAWDASGDRLFISATLPEQGGEVFVFEPGGDLRRLGPPSGLPAGTGWDLGGPARGAEAWVLETCCALDANSYDGGKALLRIDDRTGEVLDRRSLEGTWTYLVLDTGPVDAGGTSQGFLLLAPEFAWAEVDGGMLVGSPDGAVERKAWPAFAAVDW